MSASSSALSRATRALSVEAFEALRFVDRGAARVAPAAGGEMNVWYFFGKMDKSSLTDLFSGEKVSQLLAGFWERRKEAWVDGMGV